MCIVFAFYRGQTSDLQAELDVVRNYLNSGDYIRSLGAIRLAGVVANWQ